MGRARRSTQPLNSSSVSPLASAQEGEEIDGWAHLPPSFRRGFTRFPSVLWLAVAVVFALTITDIALDDRDGRRGPLARLLGHVRDVDFVVIWAAEANVEADCLQRGWRGWWRGGARAWTDDFG